MTPQEIADRMNALAPGDYVLYEERTGSKIDVRMYGGSRPLNCLRIPAGNLVVGFETVSADGQRIIFERSVLGEKMTVAVLGTMGKVWRLIE